MCIKAEKENLDLHFNNQCLREREREREREELHVQLYLILPVFLTTFLNS